MIPTPKVGQQNFLICAVIGAQNHINTTVIYQWFKNGEIMPNQTMDTLSFSPLGFADAGNYSCQANATSVLFSRPITTISNSLDVRLTCRIFFLAYSSLNNNYYSNFPLVSRPVAIRVTATGQVNPLMVRPGSPVTLTCMADLDPAIDVPVTANIHFSDPAGSTLPTTTPVMSQGSTYSSTSRVPSFGREQSGVYTCTANVLLSSENPFLSNNFSRSGILRVTTGEGIVHELLDLSPA